MLRSEQRRPSCAVPAQLLAAPQLTLIYAVNAAHGAVAAIFVEVFGVML